MKIYVKNLVTVIMENLLSIDDSKQVKKYIFDSFKHNTKVTWTFFIFHLETIFRYSFQL